MNHKRRRPKNRRAGCLMCKPWKANGAKSKDFKIEGDERPIDDEWTLNPKRAKHKKKLYGLIVATAGRMRHEWTNWYESDQARQNAIKYFSNRVWVLDIPYEIVGLVHRPGAIIKQMD